MLKKTTLLAGVTAGTVVALTAGSLVMGTFAQTSDTEVERPGKEDRQERMMEYNTKLAEELGVDYTELCDAHKTVQISFVDEKFEEGKIDAERAEEMKTKIEESECGAKGHRTRKKIRSEVRENVLERFENRTTNADQI